MEISLITNNKNIVLRLSDDGLKSLNNLLEKYKKDTKTKYLKINQIIAIALEELDNNSK